MGFSLIKRPVYYVQIKTNAFSVRCADGQKSVAVVADPPFSTERLLIGEFGIAEKLLKEAFSQCPFTLLRPTVIMHPMEMVGGGLSEVETKVLTEVAESAGAERVKIWLGNALSDHELSQMREEKN